MRLSTILAILFTCSTSFGQTTSYQNLLDTALSGHGAIFIHSKPISKIELDDKEMWNYFYFHRDYANKILDTIMFAQIIRNSKSADTSIWIENELARFLLVQSRKDYVSKKYALTKLALTDTKQIRFYKKQINNYNSADSYNKNLYYFSRPVFDDLKKYAIVQWDNAHSGLGGGGGIVLYQFQDNVWKEVGIIMNWKY